jgi:hypothetical protein
MIAAGILRAGVRRRQREAAAKLQRDAEENHLKREQEHKKATEDARLRAMRTQQTNSLNQGDLISPNASEEPCSANDAPRNQVEVQSCEARRLVATLQDGTGVVGFSARPMLSLSGTFAPGPCADTLLITFCERPPAIEDADAIRYALRCLSLLAARTAAIDGACARAAARGDAPPAELVCPITLCVMRDPVVAADGHAYERAAISEWLSRRRSSPLSNCAMPSLRLSPHAALRRSIERWAQDTLDAAAAAPAAPSPAAQPKPPVTAA